MMKISSDESRYLSLIPKRRQMAHKGSYGKLLVLAGSRGMSGAAYLAALAAYRSGTGLVKILTHEANRIILQMQLPEAIIETYGDEDGEELTRLVQSAVDWSDGCVLGPGLGTSDVSEILTETCLRAVGGALTGGTVPYALVADADALNLCARKPGLFRLLEQAAEKAEVIITPHPLEMSRLTGRPVTEITERSMETAAEFAAAHHITTVLKGANTCVVYRDGAEAYRNLRACPALAKAGSGDVLSGCIAGIYMLLRCEALRWDAEEAAVKGRIAGEAAALGVLVHGLAGSLAAAAHGTHGALAHETADVIGEVLGKYETI